ncbi:MAG: hypothetical protein K1000chlam2_00819 [Chlamydiae bacterium]|nr:hypothetical protein [Chlamydiota bacterium]
MSNTTLSLSMLPHEVLMSIAEPHLDIQGLVSFGQVATAFNAVVQNIFANFIHKIQCSTNTNQEDSIQQVMNFVEELYAKAGTLKDDRIQHLLTQPKTLKNVKKNVKLLQKYFIARDKIILWEVATPAIPNGLPLDQLETCEDVIAKAEGFSPTFNQYKHQIVGIMSLNLANKNLTHIPSEFFELSNLNLLVLTGNLLTEVSDEIGNLKQLKRLNLENNLLKSLPSQIVTLNALRDLFLAHNKLESLPSGMEGLRDFLKLTLVDNRLSSLPNGFNQIACKELDFRENRFLSMPPPFPRVEELKWEIDNRKKS